MEENVEVQYVGIRKIEIIRRTKVDSRNSGQNTSSKEKSQSGARLTEKLRGLTSKRNGISSGREGLFKGMTIERGLEIR